MRGPRCSHGCFELGDLRLQGVHRRRIRLGERLQLAFEALAALLERLPAPLKVGQIGQLELQAALGLQQLAACLVQPLLAGAERLLGLRQARILLPELGLRLGAALLGRAGAGRPQVKRLRKLRALLAPGAQLGVLCLELVGGFGHFERLPLALRRGVAPARMPKQVLLELQFRVVFLVARRHRGLRLELLQLRGKLDADVGDAREIVARVGEAVLGLAAAFLVLRDAGRLLEEHAQLLGLRLDDARDHPLLDDRVGPRAEAGAEEHVGDVAAPDVRAVDGVARLAVALQDALHGDLRVLRPLPGGAPLSVVEDQLDRRTRERRAVHRAVEDDVLHRVAAQRRGARLAKHPAHGVDDVGLAAAVRPDHADQLPRHMYRGGIDEGLEAGELYLNESHAKNDTIARRSPVMRSRPSKRLQTFPNPAPGRDYRIRMEIPEFTCLCPMTGQPDFATLLLDYVPDRLCVELKSLKLYIWSYRDQGAFHEAVTNQILGDLVAAIKPRYLRLEARFNVRGGIHTTVVAEHRKRGWKQD